MIRLENVKKSFGNKNLFEEIDISIEKGDLIAIVGKSGSGKTTLMNIMSLIEQPSSGKVLWEGEEIKANSRKSSNIMRYKIGYLFQNYALIDDKTVRENVQIGLLYYSEIKDKDEAIKSALEQVGLLGEIDQKIFTLSGGEQQRVALARLLVKPCEVIFADEPTGNLDDANSEKIMNILFDLNKAGKTIVVVTHDNRYLDKFEKVIRI
ncbi:MAG: putative bacteriocin export ABC transporter [Tissierellia bacterium]|nr:putative bacteriocin export ABC transporter [Tissierellia bacterium]